MIGLAKRVGGSGTLVLIGGGEFSFGETSEVDAVWTGSAPAGSVGFFPTASGSADYGKHFADYMFQEHGRDVDTVPVYRARDARRQKNVERVMDSAAVYLGGGIGDELVETLADTPVLEAVEERLRSGAFVVAIAAAAQAAGMWVRSLRGRETLAGFDWLESTVVDANFLPTHDHRLRRLMMEADVGYGVGLPASSALLISGDGGLEVVGSVFVLEGADEDLKLLTIDSPSGG
jgi:cyanophycinase-like exopeptidase